MSDEEPYDYDAARRAASELWLREQVTARLKRFRAERPPVFATPGELHNDIAGWVKRYLDGEAFNLILVGNVGVGKSWSLWKIKEALISAGWLRSVEIRAAHELKRTCAPPVDEVELDLLRQASLLALDDIGSIRVSDWDADNLMALVDDRWKHRRPTIITSNNPKLRDLLGERVASRLADGATVVMMTGPDLRRAR
ncbi:ATP-binding protein [Nonomuraea wenchangensis]